MPSRGLDASSGPHRAGQQELAAAKLCDQAFDTGAQRVGATVDAFAEARYDLIESLAGQRGLEHDRGCNVEAEVNASARVEDDPRFIGGVEGGMVS